MLSCNRPPEGECPYNAKGDMVHFNYAELDLCDECEKEHRKAFKELHGLGNTSTRSVNTQENNSQGSTTKKNESADLGQSVVMDSVLSYVVFPCKVHL